VAHRSLNYAQASYYLRYALPHSLPPVTAQLVTALAVTTDAVSIVEHGISVTPLMKQYGKQTQTTDL